MYGLLSVLLAACSTTQTTVRSNQRPMVSQNEMAMKAQDTIGTPVITFATPLHDFGRVEKGQLKSYDFHFTNTGDADLVIELATACTCTSIDWTRRAVRPGGKGVISIVFDSAQKDGEVTIDVDVIANTHPIVTIAQFKANVITLDE